MASIHAQNISVKYIEGDIQDIGLKEYIIKKIKKNFYVKEFWADKDISFSIEDGDFLSIVGRNGAGKSTLLKVICQILRPTEGVIQVDGKISALLEMGSGFDGDITVKENIYLRGALMGYTKKFLDEKYEEIINFAELKEFENRYFRTLSSGMKERLAFSVSSLVEPEILILDEAFSAGDGSFREKAERKMNSIVESGVITIFVSHAIDQVRRLSTKVLWLNKGEQIAFGDPHIVCDAYEKFLKTGKAVFDIKEHLIQKVTDMRCTGCGVCKNICAAGAIEMQFNNEGFLFPVIDKEKCTKCIKCVQNCPALQYKFDNAAKSKCYAVWARDDIRAVSSSGGMFTLLANHVLEKGGFVCGAVWADDYRSVYHTIISDKKDLPKLRLSKYVQSDMGTVYKDIEKLLGEDKYVLFTGCPCQVAGLQTFLGRAYENLLVCDVVCNAVNSVAAFGKFLDEREQEAGGKIAGINFRDKAKFGWISGTHIWFDNGAEYYKPYVPGQDQCVWRQGIFYGVVNRKSCNYCQYAKMPRTGDITIGDFWGVHTYKRELDDFRGTSLVLVNNKKGEVVFDAVKPNMALCVDVPLDIAIDNNWQLRAPHKAHPARKRFFDLLGSKGFETAIQYVVEHKYDAGIAGIWYMNNYGTTLTYYAFYKLLESMEVFAVMLRKPKQFRDWENVDDSHETIGGKFIYSHCPVSAPFDSFEKWKEINYNCRIFAVGPATVWNDKAYHCPNFFQLDFINDDKIKISFASSFESGFEGDSGETKRCLSRFDAISVRDSEDVAVCRNVFGITATEVLDPVFVCDFSVYEDMAFESSLDIQTHFLAAYIHGLKQYSEIMKSLSDELKCQLKNIMDIAPRPSIQDFVYYIKNCHFFVGTSFYSICFSIIFRKNFVIICEEDHISDIHLSSLLQRLNLSDRIVYLNQGNMIENMKNILEKDVDYDAVYEILNPLITVSRKWLEKNLKEK
jgi:ABC-type polysaccharide/polyol phosphate transport system ATPase subunit/coenzyme F420-reducing hydrogenase beta subunit